VSMMPLNKIISAGFGKGFGARAEARASVLRAGSVFLFALFSALPVAGQTPGAIYQPATGVGVQVMDPNGDGFISTSRLGFPVGRDGAAEMELPMVRVPYFTVDPRGDLATGSAGSQLDFIGSPDDGGSVYVLKRTVGGVEYLMVRQQVGAFEFQPGAVSLWAVGQRRQMAVEVRDPLGTPFQRAVTVVWESGDADVVEVTPEGRLVARDDGRAEVRARAENAVGTAVVQVGTRFTFSACVSSSASRLAGRGIGNGSGGGGGGGGAGAGAGCSETPLQAIMPDSVPSSGEAGLN